MVLLSIFYTNQITEGSSADCSLFILSSILALHPAIHLTNLSCHEDWARYYHIHLSVVFPPECQPGPHFVTQPILLVKTFLIFDINHQQSTRRSDQIEGLLKAIMQTTRPRILKVLPMAQVAIFKEIFDQVRKDLDCELFYSELKRHNVSVLYLLSSHR